MEITAGSPPPDGAHDLRRLADGHVPWTPRDVLFGVFWFVAIFVAGQIAIVPLAFAYGERSDEFFVSAFIAGAVVQVAIVAIAASFTFRRYGGGPERLGIGALSGRTVLWTGAALLGALVVSFTYGSIIILFDLDFLKTDCAEQIPREVRDDRMLLALASLVVIAFAPVCEELFFRGFVFPGLARNWGIVPAIVASGVLFAAAHLLYKSFVPIAFVGMIFAFVYWRSGSIFSNMLAHMAFNSISIAFIAGGSCDANNDALVPWSLFS